MACCIASKWESPSLGPLRRVDSEGDACGAHALSVGSLGSCGPRRRAPKGLMNSSCRRIVPVLVLTLWLAAPASALNLAPSAASVPAPLAAPALQIGSTGWIIWETETPVQRLALDGDTLWVGHDKGGLSRWDLATGPVATHAPADGLSGDDVMSIAVDGAGDIWLALLDGGVDRTSSGPAFDDLTPPQAVGAH